MIKQKIFFYIKFITIFFIIILLMDFFYKVTCASTPKLISTLQKAFQNIESWLITLATPAAAVAVRNGAVYEKI